MSTTTTARAALSRSARGRTTSLILLVLALLAGAGLRLTGLGDESFWLDEIDMVTLTALPLPQMLQGLQLHASPPLDYLIMHGMQRFGRDEALLRLPAALASTAAILMLFLVGRLMYGYAAGVAAAVLTAFSLPAIAYAQEARMYALLILVVGAVVAAAAWAVRSPGRRAPWAVGAVLGALLLYTHYFGALVLVALGLLWLGALAVSRGSRGLLLSGALAFGGAGLLFAPWLPSMAAQLARRGGGLSYALPLDQFWETALRYLPGGLPWWATILAWLLYAGGVVALLRRGQWAMAALTVVVVWVPLALVYGVPQLGRIVTPRNLLVSLPGYIAGVAVGIAAAVEWLLARLRAGADRQAATATVAALIALAVAVVPAYDMLRSYHAAGWWLKGPVREQWKQVAGLLREQMGAGDLILTRDSRERFLLAFYLDPESIRGQQLDPFLQNPATATSGVERPIPQITLQAPRETLVQAIQRAPAVWFVRPDAEALRGLVREPGALEPVAQDLNLPVAYGRAVDAIEAGAVEALSGFPGAGWSDQVAQIDGQNTRWMAEDATLNIPLGQLPPSAVDLRLFVPEPLAGGALEVSVGGLPAASVTLAAGWQEVSAPVPAEAVAGRQQLEVVLRAGPLPTGRDPMIGATGVRAPQPLVAASSGLPESPYAEILVGPERYSWFDAGRGYGRGYQLVALDPASGALLDWQVFDTDADPVESDRMLAFVEALPAGAIVVGAVKEDGAASLTERGVEALRLLGSAVDIRGSFRSAHALVGVKGAAPGTAAEQAFALTGSVVVGDDPRGLTVALASATLRSGN